jgi:hypothetical protein
MGSTMRQLTRRISFIKQGGSGMQAIALLLPEEMWICLIVLAGFLVMTGFRKAGLALLGSVVLMSLLSPFLDSLLNALPVWMLLVLMFFFALSLFKLLFGRNVADHVIAHILYDMIRMPFRFIGWLFRGSRRRT